MSVMLVKIKYKLSEMSSSVPSESIATVSYDPQKDIEIFRIGSDSNFIIQPEKVILPYEILLDYPEVSHFKTWLVCDKNKKELVHFRDLTKIEEPELRSLIREFKISGFKRF